MKTSAWLLCCFGLLAPLQLTSADEPPHGFVKITVGVEGEGLEQIPILGPLLKYLVAGMEKPCTEQVQLELPPPAACPASEPHDRGVPMLSKLPYVARLFKNIGPAPADADCETADADCPAPRSEFEFRFVGPDALERIGVDFDCETTGNCAQCQGARRPPVSLAPPAPRCAAPTANCPAPVAVYGVPPTGYAAHACEVLPAPLAVMQQVQAFIGRDELLDALMEARVEAAVAQTALKAREESDARQTELIKELLSSQVENAKLAAKLELAAEKEKMLTSLYEARAELTALQAHVARENEVAHRKRQAKGVEARRSPESAETLR